MIKPRFYQQDSHDAAINWMRSNSEPCLMSLPMGAGKSIIVAMIAKSLHAMSKGKRVLCLCPTRELVQQNYNKYISIGEKASIYSASIGKSLRHPVVFATEQSIIKVIDNIASDICAVVVDECHKTTNTTKSIIESIQNVNPLVRVCGLTATPYSLGKGYCYEIDENNVQVEEAVSPYYKKMIYSITADELIALGFLTPPQIGLTSDHYDTSDIKLSGFGFKDKDLDKAFVGKEVTATIVNDVLLKTQDRKSCLVFASTTKHMEEIFKLFPEDQTRMLSGKTAKKEREQIINDFKIFKFKYLINVAILTTGFDHESLDAIAILRPTESAGLYQQILGRGTRLAPNKKDFLVLDYTDNIPQFFGDSGNVFQPNIKAYGSKPQTKIEVSCPECGTKQEHSKRPKYEQWDDFGYAVDLAGDVLEPKIPAHYGRRCLGVTPLGKNQFKRCDYFWAHKECPSCAHKNDIAARECEACGLVLIDPNAKLSEQAIVIKQGEKYTTNVNALSIKESTNGGVMYAIFDTPHGEISAKFYPNNPNRFIAQHANIFNRATECGEKRPTQIEYSLKKDGQYTIHRYIPPFVEN